MNLNLNKTNAELEQEILNAEEFSRQSKTKNHLMLILSIIAIMIPLLALFIYFSFTAYRTSHCYDNLKTENLTAEPKYDDEYFRITDTKGKIIYKTTYSFEVDGREYKGSSLIPKSPASNLTYLVIYCPTDPSVNRLNGGKNEDKRAIIPSLIVLIAIIVSAITFVVIIYRMRKI